MLGKRRPVEDVFVFEIHILLLPFPDRNLGVVFFRGLPNLSPVVMKIIRPGDSKVASAHFSIP
jgi:hypothetical protein